MADFWAVLRDLYAFVRHTIFASGTPKAEEHLSLPLVPVRAELPAPASVPTPSLTAVSTAPQGVLGLTGTGYITTNEAVLLERPVLAFDAPRQKLPYGTTVSILGYHGRFANVATPAGTGWVRKDDIATDKAAVWPQLTHARTYLASDAETKLIRKFLADEFFMEDIFLPLSTEEFVTYRLRQDGRVINWGEERPRTAGRWHELLRGRRGIFTSIEPKTGAVMEAYPESQEPFLAYVTKVTPEETIEIEAVGEQAEGEYRTSALSHEAWISWRPVFIRVT